MTNNLKYIIMPDGTKLDLPTGSTGGSAKIGDIGFAPYVDETTNERRRLNGQVLIKDQYPAFVTWLTGLHATTPSLFATEDEWQSIKTASRLGQCGKFVIGDTTIRLPQIININGLVDMSNAGLIKDESLPNVKGTIDGVFMASYETSTQTGAFKKSVRTPATNRGVDGGNETRYGKVVFNASDSLSIYQDGAVVQQEAIQYPFYITVNTGSETTKPTIDDYTVTTAYQYGMSQYYKGIMNSGAWLRSNGQMNPKATYEGLYNWALAQLNAGVEGFKSSTASDITDYDFVINQTNESFRLPLKNGMEGVFASRVKGNGLTIGLTNGTQTAGPTKSGIVVDLTVPEGWNLYYYCGNVEERPHLVNVARIEEALVDKVDVTNTQWAINACMPDYSATIIVSSLPYTAPADGQFCWVASFSSYCAIKINGVDVTKSGEMQTARGLDNATLMATILISKGDIISLYAGNLNKAYFFPLKGAN